VQGTLFGHKYRSMDIQPLAAQVRRFSIDTKLNPLGLAAMDLSPMMTL